MRKKALFILIISLISSVCLGYSQLRNNSNQWIPVHQGNQWHYIDLTGKVILSLDVVCARRFSEGLAAVNLGGRWTNNDAGIPIVVGGKWGYINESAELIIKPQFDLVRDFSERHAVVSSNHKYGYINNKGEKVIDLKYDSAWDFREGLAMVWIGGGMSAKTWLIDFRGNLQKHPGIELGVFSNGLLRADKNGKLGFIDKNVKFVIEPQYGILNAGNFCDGLARVKKGHGLKWQYIDKTGQIAFPQEFDDAYDFSEGLARVWTDVKMHYIDKSGQIAFTHVADSGSDFHEGLAHAWVGDDLHRGRGDKHGYIDKSGQWAINPIYDNATDFYYGSAAVKIGDEWKYINLSGECIYTVPEGSYLSIPFFMTPCTTPLWGYIKNEESSPTPK